VYRTFGRHSHYVGINARCYEGYTYPFCEEDLTFGAASGYIAATLLLLYKVSNDILLLVRVFMN
jgi:hypothetical protein